MGASAIYGYKASTYVATAGITTNEMRASVIEAKKSNGWVVLFSARVGKAYASNPTAQLDMALYNASGVSATTLVGQADSTVNVTAVMQNASQGVDVSKAPATPLKRYANLPYALVIRSNSNHFNFGMNASGQRMGFKTSASFPSPYAATSNNPNGRIGIWATEILNTPPKTPSNVLPIEGASTTDATPAMAADFRDDEEVLPGFALGTADRLKKYQFKILDSDGVVVKDSTVLTADSTMRSNRRATWTPTGDLPSGDYTGWCQLYDEFDEFSAVKTWAFSVNTSSLSIELAAANVNDPDPLRTISDIPGFTFTWDSSTSLAMTFGSVRIREESTDSVVRTETFFAEDLVDGASLTYTGSYFFTAAGWADLPLGKRYRFEARGYDGTTWSGYSASPWFIVNFPPYAPDTFDPPNGKGVTSIPFISARFLDADDESVDLVPEFWVRPEGDVTDGVEVSAGGIYLGDNRWGAQPNSSEVTGLGDWEVRGRATDPVGEVGSFGFWSSFTYTTAPNITFIDPATYGSDFETDSPTLSWTVDRTQVSFRVRIYDVDYSLWTILTLLASLTGSSYNPTPVHDSGYRTSSAGTYSVPDNKLLNGHSYTLIVDVRTSDGLDGQEVSGFNIDYIERGPVTGFSVELVRGPFESTDRQASSVDILWTPVPEVAAPSTLLAISHEGALEGWDNAGPITVSSTGTISYVDSGIEGLQAAYLATDAATISADAFNNRVETSAGTVLFRFKPDAISGSQTVFSIGQSAADLLHFRRNALHQWTFGGHDSTGWKETTFNLTLTGWTLVEIQWSGSGSTCRIRFDGGSWYTVGSALVWTDLSTGIFHHGGFGGAIHNLVVHNAVLSDEDREAVVIQMQRGPVTVEGVLPFATEPEFGGYVVRRENLDTGEVERSVRLPSRYLTGYTDREARSGFNYRWSVSYLYVHEDDVWVESTPAYEEFGLNLANLVLSDLEVDGLSVPIVWWDDRAFTKHTATEVVSTLGVKPIIFQGELNYRQVNVSFHTVDDPNGEFTAQEHMEAIEAFADVTYTSPDGYPVPRNICLRTPTRVLMYGSLISPLQRGDDTNPQHLTGSFTFVENATYLEGDE